MCLCQHGVLRAEDPAAVGRRVAARGAQRAGWWPPQLGGSRTLRAPGLEGRVRRSTLFVARPSSRRFWGRVPGAFFGDASRKRRDLSQKPAFLSCAGTRSKRAALPPVCPASRQGGSGRAPFSCLAPERGPRRERRKENPKRPRQTVQGGLLGPAWT